MVRFSTLTAAAARLTPPSAAAPPDRAIRLALLAGAAALVALALAYMGRLAVLRDDPRDFKYLWLAGDIWARGGNPYLPSYSAEGDAAFGPVALHRWLYTPHIWPIAWVFSLPEFGVAVRLWAVFNMTLTALGSALVVMAAGWRPSVVGAAPAAALFAVVFFYAAVAIGGSTSLATGQMTHVVFVGLACFALALQRDSAPAMVVALFLLTMKASLGLPFVAFALATPRWRPAVVIAGALALATAAPVLLSGGLVETLRGYLDGLAAYGGYQANFAEATTGLRNLVHHGLGVDLPGMALALLAASVAVALARLRGADLAAGGAAAAGPCALLIASTLFVLPLHLYDLLMLAALLALAARPVAALMLAPPLLLLVRPEHLGRATGLIDGESGFPGSLFASLALLALLAATWAVARR